jgi:hypothetical protein
MGLLLKEKHDRERDKYHDAQLLSLDIIMIEITEVFRDFFQPVYIKTPISLYLTRVRM